MSSGSRAGCCSPLDWLASKFLIEVCLQCLGLIHGATPPPGCGGTAGLPHCPLKMGVPDLLHADSPMMP